MKDLLWLFGWIAALAVLWGVIAVAFLLQPAVVLTAAAVVVVIGLVVLHEFGPNGPRARKRQASENLRDIACRARERDPHSSTGRTVLGASQGRSRRP